MTAVEELLAWGSGQGQEILWSGLLCFLRVGALFALLPVLGDLLLPLRLRLACAIAMTIVIAAGAGQSSSLTLGAIFAEVVTGLMIGAGFRFLVIALQTAGMMAAQATSLAQIFAGAGSEPQSAISNVLSYAGLAVLCTLGLPADVANLIIHSYEIIPQGSWPLTSDAATWTVDSVRQSFTLAFSLAAPFLLGALLYNAALGAINRAMPMLMVALIGAPALTLGSLLLLAALTPFLLTLWLTLQQSWLTSPFTPGAPP